MNHTVRTILLAGAASAVLATAARAQTSAPENTTAPTVPAKAAKPALSGNRAPSLGLEEVTVVAQRRKENLQRVPITVTAISGATATKRGVLTPQDLTFAVPGLQVQTQAASVQIYMRGVGTDATQAGTENAVATFLDGVYIASENALFFDFDNVSQLEVLKGPQGTLYGRNAVAGVINVVTKDPSNTPHYEANVGYGNLQDFRSSFYASGPVTSDITASLAGLYNFQGKGAGIDVYNGSQVNQDMDGGLSGKVVYRPNNDLSITFSSLWDYHSGSYGLAYHEAGNGSRGPDGLTEYPYGYYDVNTNLKPVSNSNFYFEAVHINYDLGFAKLTSISAYQTVAKHFDYDTDGSPMPVIDVHFRQFDRTVSEELHLSNPDTESKLTWLTGFYFFHDTAGYNPFGLSGAGLGGLIVNKQASQSTRSLAGFGQATYEFLPGTRATAGIRYTSDHRALYAADFTSAGLIDPEQHLSNTSSKPTWRFALDHTFGNKTLIYASYSRGFKSGEFNEAAFPSSGTTVVAPETLDDFEGGFKSQFFDNRLRLNAGGYYYNYKNMQFSAYNGTTDALLNAASSHIYGVDVDVIGQVAPGLSVSAALETVHARFSKFPNAPITTNPELGNIQMPGDATGNTLEKAPDYVINAGVDYLVPLGPYGELDNNVNFYHNSGYFWAPDNRVKQSPYSILNASVEWTNPNGHYHITAWGKNLTGQHYLAQLTEQTGLGDTAVAAAPRMYGVRLGVSF